MNIVHFKTFCFGIVIALLGAYCLYKAEFLYTFLGNLDGAAPVWNSYALFGWIIIPVSCWVVLATRVEEDKFVTSSWQVGILIILGFLSWFFGIFNELETPYEDLQILLQILAVLHIMCSLTLVIPSVRFSRVSKFEYPDLT